MLTLLKLGADVLHGDGGCESGGIAGDDSLPASTASAGLAWEADGHAEREAAKAMVADIRQNEPQAKITLGADKGYNAAEFIQALQAMDVTPHIAQNKSNRAFAVPDEIAQAEGYAISQQKRKLIKQGFG